MARIGYIVITAFAFLFVACESKGASPTSAPQAQPTTAPALTVAPQATKAPSFAPTAASPTASNSAVVLIVQDVTTDIPAYDRDDWNHWIDADGDCQNARHVVLIEESAIAPTLNDSGCAVVSGLWLAPFSGVSVNLAKELDVDHMVPLANAHKSGAWAWDATRKKNYANFLDDSHHLIAVTASANRSKGARGPEEWQPPDPTYWCWYATDWVLIKSTWGLSATEQEWNALAAMLDTCNQPLTVVINRDSQPPVPATTPPSAPTTTFDPFVEHLELQ